MPTSRVTRRAIRRRRPTRGLPAALRRLFWDHDASELEWGRDRDLIIGRVLSEGGWADARLVRGRYGDAAVRAWLERHRCRGLSPARIRFWELILRLPSRPAAAWVATARRDPWHARTARR